MSARKGSALKPEAAMKEYYEQSKLPPYLHAAKRPQTYSAAAQIERMVRSTSEMYVNEVDNVGEADAAAGKIQAV